MTFLHPSVCSCCRLFNTSRRDRVVCSTTCFHGLKDSTPHEAFRKGYAAQGLDDGFLGELAALNVLRSDLAEQVRSGALPAGADGARLWRAAVQDAYMKQLLQKPAAKRAQH